MKFSMPPQAVALLYESLRAQRPFRRWKLPHADEVEFRVNDRRDKSGEHLGGDTHVIWVSLYHNTSFVEAVMTLAHEMIHQAEAIAKKPVGHGKGFHRRRKAVARALGVEESRI